MTQMVSVPTFPRTRAIEIGELVRRLENNAAGGDAASDTDLHELQELDDDLGGRSEENLPARTCGRKQSEFRENTSLST